MPGFVLALLAQKQSWQCTNQCAPQAACQLQLQEQHMHVHVTCAARTTHTMAWSDRVSAFGKCKAQRPKQCSCFTQVHERPEANASLLQGQQLLGHSIQSDCVWKHTICQARAQTATGPVRESPTVLPYGPQLLPLLPLLPLLVLLLLLPTRRCPHTVSSGQLPSCASPPCAAAAAAVGVRGVAIDSWPGKFPTWQSVPPLWQSTTTALAVSACSKPSSTAQCSGLPVLQGL